MLSYSITASARPKNKDGSYSLPGRYGFIKMTNTPSTKTTIKNKKSASVADNGGVAFEKALNAIKSIPDRDTGFSGSAGRARSHTIASKKARMIADLYKARASDSMKEEGATKRTGMIGQNQLENTRLVGQNRLENTRLVGQNQLENTRLAGKNQLADTFLRGVNSANIENIRAGSNSDALAEKIRQYEQGRRDRMVGAYMKPDPVSGEYISREEAENKYDLGVKLRNAGSPDERRLIMDDEERKKNADIISEMTPEQRYEFMTSSPRNRRIYKKEIEAYVAPTSNRSNGGLISRLFGGNK